MRILLVSHAFPPAGGPGVQRALKFATEAVNAGHSVHVLAAWPDRYPFRDPGLLANLPAGLEISRLPDPARFGLGRQGIGFLLNTLPVILRERMLRRPDAVLITGNPFAPFLATLPLAAAGVPVFLDYRDAWTLNPYRTGNPPSRPERAAERAVLERARAVFFVSDPMREDHARAHPDLRDRFHTVLNGYDPADFAGVVAEAREPAGTSRRRVRLVYTGSFTHYRSPGAIARALEALANEIPDLALRLEWIAAGDPGPEWASLTEASPLRDIATHRGYLPHREAIALMLSADVLLVVNGRDRSEATGKIFEYIGSGRPILLVGNPESAAAAILSRSGRGRIVSLDDPDALRNVLGSMVRTGRFEIAPEPPGGHPGFTRAAMARKMLSILGENLLGIAPDRLESGQGEPS